MENIKFYSTVLSISTLTVAFIAFFFVSNNKIIARFFVKNSGEEAGQIKFVLFQRLTGVLCFGIFPALMLVAFKNDSFYKSWLAIHLNFSSFIIIVTIGGILVLINWVASRSPENLAKYPQIRARAWPFSLLLLSAISWIAYLFAYEFMFRGFFLFNCVGEIGIFASIIINVVFYSLVHLHKGKKETLGSIPLGIIFCLITIHFGTIWGAFWIHCCLALSNEWFSIKYHKEIKAG